MSVRFGLRHGFFISVVTGFLVALWLYGRLNSPLLSRWISILNMGKCEKLREVAFIKSHKVGGTTVQNILQRFGEKNKLFAAIPRHRNILAKDFSNTVGIPKGSHFSLLFCHTTFFNRTAIVTFLPKGKTLYFTIVREPLAQLLSSFNYYKYKWRFSYLAQIKTNSSAFKEYFYNPDKYDPPDINDCYTNNRMAYDLGLAETDFHKKSAIEKWLKELDTKLDFVLVMERFIPSMVLLKRKFCWDLKDILYFPQNAQVRSRPVTLSPGDIALYNKRYLADVMLYNYSLARFKRDIAQQLPDFQEEVGVFEKLLKQVQHYCLSAYKPDILLLETLKVQKTKYSAEFTVTPWDCEMMMLSELEFMRRTRKKQKTFDLMEDLLASENTMF